ncbi:hypothetical protein [Diaphorobacter caeni]|uniref:hypothetical protein n=1 Tax=Diaphorobacter caeni TaxID=2784387 RepID=UPI00188F9260|nr:hypothetical protein [Diaphorobacter caeni]MBF5002786.1 hypothetical protein [Diaphorobacter caeni]
MRYTTSAPTRSLALAATLFLALGLPGCGGGSDSSSTTTSGGSSSGGGSSSACNYTDLVTSSERAQANSCGIQVSGAYGNADAHLGQVIAACKQGKKAEADAHYENVYKKAVQYARDNAKTLNCGGNNGPTLPNPSTQSYYNMCGKVSNSQRVGLCYGPLFKDQGGCGSSQGFTYISQHSSESACVSARTSWLNSK